DLFLGPALFLGLFEVEPINARHAHGIDALVVLAAHAASWAGQQCIGEYAWSSTGHAILRADRPLRRASAMAARLTVSLEIASRPRRLPLASRHKADKRSPHSRGGNWSQVKDIC